MIPRSRNLLFSTASCLVLCAPAVAQAVQDVGLTLDGGVLTVIHGQACGPFSCAAIPAGTVGSGSTRRVVHYAAPRSPFALAIGLQGPCFAVPGILNNVGIAAPLTLAVGVTGAPSPIGICRQGRAVYRLVLPANPPSGFSFRLQSLGVSNTGALAFGPVLEVAVR